MRQPRRTASIGALLGALAVIMGAFGAHGLKAALTPEALAWWKTASDYHLAHALLIVGIGLAGAIESLSPRPRALVVASMAAFFGLFVFCGSLYLMALTGMRWLGAITPFGGTSFIIAWLALGWAIWPSRGASSAP
jgi:uncharacterized membrane protein YgdD (TMEM256/DUF423 family)